MGQRRKLLIFGIVDGKRIIRLIVAIAIDEHHIAVIGAIGISIGQIAVDDAFFDGFFEQIAERLPIEFFARTNCDDIAGIGNFCRKLNAEHIGVLYK